MAAKRVWHCVTCQQKGGYSVRLYGDKLATQHALDGHEIHEQDLCFRYGDEDGAPFNNCLGYVTPDARTPTT